MLGATPKGRLTEQHDIFFGIGQSIECLIPQINAFWPEASGNIHIDVWREVTFIDGFKIEIVSKDTSAANEENLFFINLGGYKESVFDEFHYKVLTVATSLAEATKKAKSTTFYKHYGFKGAVSHVDDKYGIDVDDIHNVNDILTADLKQNYSIKISPAESTAEDHLHIGYLKLSKLS